MFSKSGKRKQLKALFIIGSDHNGAFSRSLQLAKKTKKAALVGGKEGFVNGDILKKADGLVGPETKILIGMHGTNKDLEGVITHHVQFNKKNLLPTNLVLSEIDALSPGPKQIYMNSCSSGDVASAVDRFSIGSMIIAFSSPDVVSRSGKVDMALKRVYDGVPLSDVIIEDFAALASYGACIGVKSLPTSGSNPNVIQFKEFVDLDNLNLETSLLNSVSKRLKEIIDVIPDSVTLTKPTLQEIKAKLMTPIKDPSGKAITILEKNFRAFRSTAVVHFIDRHDAYALRMKTDPHMNFSRMNAGIMKLVDKDQSLIWSFDKACWDGNMKVWRPQTPAEIIKIFKDKGVNLNAHNSGGETLLTHYYKRGLFKKRNRARVIDFLNFGLDPDGQNKNGKTLLYYAIKYKDKELVNLLLEKKADPSLGKQIKLNKRDSDGSNIEAIKKLFYDGKSDNPIQDAIQKGFYGSAKLLISSQEDDKIRDSFGNDGGLIDAAIQIGKKTQNFELADQLLAKGRDEDCARLISSLIKKQDFDYLYHISNNNEKIIELHGALIKSMVLKSYEHIPKEGRSNLSFFMFEDPKLCEILIKTKQMDLNEIDSEGSTILHRSYNSPKIANLALRFGADPNIRNKFGKTPIYYASSEIASLLFEYGANINVRDVYGTSASESLLVNGPCVLDEILSGSDETIKSTAIKSLEDCISDFDYSPGGFKRLTEEYQSVEFVKLFIKKAKLTDFAELDEKENTRIHNLILKKKYKMYEVMPLLKEKGVDVNRLNKDNYSALTLALAKKDTKAANMLLMLDAEVFNGQQVEGGNINSLHNLFNSDGKPALISDLIKSGNHGYAKFLIKISSSKQLHEEDKNRFELIKLAMKADKSYELADAIFSQYSAKKKSEFLITLKANNSTEYLSHLSSKFPATMSDDIKSMTEGLRVAFSKARPPSISARHSMGVLETKGGRFGAH